MTSEYMYGMEALGEALTVAAVSNLVGLLAGLLTYVLTAAAFYTMAKRRGIRHAWLSWIPIGNVWILGSLADQYRYVARGQVKGKRKALLTLNLLLIAVLVGFIVCMVFVVNNMVQADLLGYSEEQMLSGLIGPLVAMVGLMLPLFGFAVAEIIIHYMALYDVYMSANPEHAVLFLVLSIFVNVTQPIFLFVSRKKDLGMVRQIPRQNPYYQNYQGGPNYRGYQQYPGNQNDPNYPGSQQPRELPRDWQQEDPDSWN